MNKKKMTVQVNDGYTGIDYDFGRGEELNEKLNLNYTMYLNFYRVNLAIISGCKCNPFFETN